MTSLEVAFAAMVVTTVTSTCARSGCGSAGATSFLLRSGDLGLAPRLTPRQGGGLGCCDASLGRASGGIGMRSGRRPG
jgi:hypothetical protein